MTKSHIKDLEEIDENLLDTYYSQRLKDLWDIHEAASMFTGPKDELEDRQNWPLWVPTRRDYEAKKDKPAILEALTDCLVPLCNKLEIAIARKEITPLMSTDRGRALFEPVEIISWLEKVTEEKPCERMSVALKARKAFLRRQGTGEQQVRELIANQGDAIYKECAEKAGDKPRKKQIAYYIQKNYLPELSDAVIEKAFKMADFQEPSHKS